MKPSYSKTLSKNDTGESGGHQGGILVPKKDLALLKFFPQVDLEEFNPEAWIICVDPDGEEWKMRYVYYNGKTFNPKRSTRNEYRITYMTKFFNKWSARCNDQVIFTATNSPNRFEIEIKKASKSRSSVIVLTGWNRVC